MDITNKKQIRDFIRKNEIKIINCSAYTAVDLAETERTVAYSVNHTGVRNLVEISHLHQIYLIHFSTDFVFSGLSATPYLETSEAPSPVGVYGASKLAGEKEILNSDINAAIFRVSWLYSPFGKNFVKTMIRLGDEKDEIRVVSDQRGSPTSAIDLSNFIDERLEVIVSNKGQNLYHFSSGVNISWHDFAKEIITRTEKKV